MGVALAYQEEQKRKEEERQKIAAEKKRLQESLRSSPQLPPHPTSWGPLVQQNWTEHLVNLVRQSTSRLNLYGNEIAPCVVD